MESPRTNESLAPSDRSPAIEAQGLVKRYGRQEALRGIDLRVPSGGCFGLLGPNGAGKSTTVAILTTLARPTAGSARLLGRDVVTERAAVRREIGVVFQESSLDRELTAREHLDLQARLYHLDQRRRRVDEALAGVDLTADADRTVREYSGGMKRRLEIARGLLHRPRVLFLDEPTLGLDVRARRSVWSHLLSLRESGETTLFLTTHSMEEADRLCDRLAILDRGRLVAEDTPGALKAALGGDVVELALEKSDAAAELLAGDLGADRVRLEPAPGDPEAPARLRVTLPDAPQRLAGLLDRVRPFGVREVVLHRPSLEDVFLQHTGRPFESELPEESSS